MSFAQAFNVLVALLVITNPVGALPVFLTVTSDQSKRKKRETARVTALAVAAVLGLVVFVGNPLLKLFGISLASFRVGGGILILLMAMAMLHAKHSRVQHCEEESDEASEKDDVGVVPLAIPLLAGPGAISTVIIYSHQVSSWSGRLGLVGLCLIVAICVWLILHLATPLEKWLGKTGINIVTRIMGLILAAVAIEFITGGLAVLLPGLKG